MHSPNFTHTLTADHQRYKIALQLAKSDIVKDVRGNLTDSNQFTLVEQELLDEASRLTKVAIDKWSDCCYPETEELFKKALDIWEKVLGPENMEVATGLYNLANLYYVQSKYDEAADLYNRSLAIQEKIQDPENAKLADNLHWLAETYFANQEYDKAYEPYERVIAIRERSLGTESPEIADALLDIAHLYYFVGRYREAEPFYLRALSIREKILGNESIGVADCCKTWQSSTIARRKSGRIRNHFIAGRYPFTKRRMVNHTMIRRKLPTALQTVWQTKE